MGRFRYPLELGRFAAAWTAGREGADVPAWTSFNVQAIEDSEEYVANLLEAPQQSEPKHLADSLEHFREKASDPELFRV